MEYITIDDNKIITGVCCGETLPENAIEVSSNFCGIVGDNVNYFNDDWTKKTYTELYENSLISKSEYYVLRTNEIIQKLNELDLLELRPVAAIINGTSTDEDKNKIAEIENQKTTLRTELATYTTMVL